MKTVAHTPAVALQGVHKSFNDTPALTDLEVVAPNGKITVLLGPNGAGKTTAIRCITGAMSADSGSVRTLGLDPERDGEEVRSQCGVVSARPALYDRLTGWDNLIYAAELHSVERRIMKDRIRVSAERFGIEQSLDVQVGGYSTGMKTRLALARSVLHEPQLLLFDEPTSGLDPESAQAVLKLIREMTADGHTIVMCTHHLVEAEGLADHVIMLDGGTDLVSGQPGDLTRTFWPEDSVDISIDDDPSILGDLSIIAGVRSAEPMNRGVRVILDDPSVTPGVVSAIVHAGVRVTRVVPHEPTLEDLYFAVRRDAHDLGESMPKEMAR
ncbi:MAG: ABC transporter ATP-binding protein [Acidimicrobiales bacterium]|nr:ABC transporter ATP-binding protein [Acidimicrobiales bacterium]MDG2216913.1 ABC transporter ATP-binding protein [Acidimicrobiales bacterium]